MRRGIVNSIKRTPITILLCFFSGLVWADFFPISGYGCEKLYQADSCNINSVLFHHNERWDSVDTWFNRAEQLDMKILLSSAVKPNTHWAWNITRFSRGQRSIYEAESSYFSHEFGDSYGNAWAAWTPDTGWLQEGPWTDEQFHNWHTPDTASDSLTYYAYYTLRASDTTETNPICTLFVRKRVMSDTDTTVEVKAYRVLTGQDFADAGGGYKQFLVSFAMDKGEKGDVDYAVWYIGTDDSLYSDNVEVRDAVADSLKEGMYDDPIEDIAEYYNDKEAMFRYYMLDEPQPDQYWASKHVNFLLKNIDSTRVGIQAVCHQKLFDTYLDSVNTDELLVDYYPLWGKECLWGDRIPEDSGGAFQEQFDVMCDIILGEARRVVKLHADKEFWYIPQAFGHAVTNSSYDWDSTWNDSIPYADEGWWREPTPREMALMVWLALAYGAKGICYYRYHSVQERYVKDGYEDYHWIVGMTTPKDTLHGAVQRPLWYTIESINQELDSLSDVLLTFESDTVFKHPDIDNPGIPADCFIDSISNDDTVQVGTFVNTENDSFFIIVNRLCQISDSDTVTVRIKVDSIFLYDLYTAEAIRPDSVFDGKSTFSLLLAPGQGRCFQIVPFAQDFTINDNASYSNMRFVALSTTAWPQENVDSMNISQTYHIPPDTLTEHEYSTGWIPYDTAYCWYLREGIKAENTVKIRYKASGFSESPEYLKNIDFDNSSPTGSFVINNDSAFTTNSSVTLRNSVTDTVSGVSEMRFGNKYLQNLVENSAFALDTNWSTNTTVYHDSLELFEIPACTTGNYFYQSIPRDSLASFFNDTLLLSTDLVSDDLVGDVSIKVQYVYEPDTQLWEPHPCGTSITIPSGTNAHVSHYNLASYFMYQPDTSVSFVEVRVGIWIVSDSINSGRMFVDNLRLDVVGPSDDYTRFDDYDTLKHDWALVPGNGVRKVYGQFADSAGNETGIWVDSIIVDAIPPAAPYVSSRMSENDIVLSWNTVRLDTSGNADTIDYYIVYRDTLPVFIPGVSDSIGVVGHPDTTYVDSNALDYPESYYYLVTTVDCARNVSAKSNMGYKFSRFFRGN